MSDIKSLELISSCSLSSRISAWAYSIGCFGAFFAFGSVALTRFLAGACLRGAAAPSIAWIYSIGMVSPPSSGSETTSAPVDCLLAVSFVCVLGFLKQDLRTLKMGAFGCSEPGSGV